MAKTERMAQIEAMLAADPTDAFLRYGLAMEHAGAGDDAAAVAELRDLIAKQPEPPYVPAYLQAGQALMRLGKENDAAEMLRAGIAAAKQTGNDHARGEMEGFLATLE
jgi:predicted Zn-dependent protease